MVAFFLGCKGLHDGWRGKGRGKTRFVLIPSLVPLLEAMGYELYQSLLSLLNQTLTHGLEESSYVKEDRHEWLSGFKSVWLLPEVRVRTGNRARLYN